MAGAFLLNGNAEREDELLRVAAPLLLGSRHDDPAVASSRRVLLVTAGWAEQEHDEAHVKRAINALGLPSSVEHGFDQTLVNLSLHEEVRRLLETAPVVREAWSEMRRVVEVARSFYLAHNAHLIALVRRAVADARGIDATLGFARLVGDEAPLHTTETRPLLGYTLARELRHALRTLEANDDRLLELLRELEDHAFDAGGIGYVPEWRGARERLERRILEANAIVLFGGQLDPILEGMRLFRLREPLAEALRRGAVFVAMSAGAMSLCERVIVYDDFAETRRDFQLYDRGLGLVRDLQLFPHCMDRIHTDDADNLAYLAHRFRHRVCVGLNQRSYLLLDAQPRRAVGYGDEDGVYVFAGDGTKLRYDKGEPIPLAPER